MKGVKVDAAGNKIKYHSLADRWDHYQIFRASPKATRKTRQNAEIWDIIAVNQNKSKGRSASAETLTDWFCGAEQRSSTQTNLDKPQR